MHPTKNTQAFLMTESLWNLKIRQKCFLFCFVYGEFFPSLFFTLLIWLLVIVSHCYV